jgi:serine/threonine protein kinase
MESTVQSSSASDRTVRIRVPPSTDQVSARQEGSDAKTVLTRDAPGPHSQTPPHDMPQEELFQSYAVLGKIGDGGMGVVYLAKDKRLGRFVAIKRLKGQGQASVLLRQRFLQEARAVAALTHIHIVHIYALGEDTDGPYIVMEYIAGPDGKSTAGRPPDTDRPTPPLTLDQYISHNGQLTIPEAVDLLIKIGRAVAYAHSCGVIHRDLKPSNVLLDKTNEPKIVDFGLARLLSTEENKLTVPGEKLLSLGYGAPEQEQDASLSDERADVYGLGALLYFAITGQNPRYFREQDIPVALRDVLVKALATDRDQRFPTALSFTDALLATQNRTRIETPTVKTTWHCKWCDAVNPLPLRFCAECGWDGGETCPECHVDTFVGVQFCGSCGADARAYEAMNQVLQRMRAAMDQHAFDRVLSLGGRTHGFEAAGPSGRRLLKDVQDLREQAECKIARREELLEQIPLEMRAENYERALAFIREVRSLDENRRIFEEEERQIPALSLTRDLARARRAVRQREWETASRICEEILRHAPENTDVLFLRKRIGFHRWVGRAEWAAAAAALVAAAYLLSLPAVGSADSLPRFWRSFYTPARACYAYPPLSGLLNRYCRLWGRPNLVADLRSVARSAESPVSQPVPSAEIVRLQGAYNRLLQTIDSDQQRNAEAWPQDYLRDLGALAERRRVDGDFDGWALANAELKQFIVSEQIGDAATKSELPELAILMQKYRDRLSLQRFDRNRRIVAATRKYINDLADLQRDLTREGKMNLAAAVNTELRRAQNGREFREAEAGLAALPEGTGSTKPDAGVPLIEPERIAELAPLRARHRAQIDAVTADYEHNRKEWPAHYRAALEDHIAQCQKQGNYDDWQKAKNELDRFDADPQLQPKDLLQQPPRLVKIQKDQIEFLNQLRRSRAAGVVKATDEHLSRLEELQKRFTQGNKMEMASAVNQEIKQIRGSPEYTAAKAELAPPVATATNKVSTAGG